MKIVPYSRDLQSKWDDFISSSKNGTFLLQRNYIEYHADRFDDCSLCFFDSKGRMRAVFPATKKENVLTSHGGLTYGGLISGVDMTTPLMLQIFTALKDYASSYGFSKIIYKTIPSIYSRLPAQEDLYALFLNGATLVRRDVLSVIEQQRPGPIQERRKRSIRHAKNASLLITNNGDPALFWPILERNLEERHSTKPVHTLAEIRRLAAHFPKNIEAHWVSDKLGNILAGVIMYVTEIVAHAQYITTSTEGRAIGALDLLFSNLINSHYTNKLYFDFGISNTDEGRKLNEGLIEQKEGFGARAIAHDHYELALR